MSDVAIGALGALAGGILAVFANIVVLPRVLAAQSRRNLPYVDKLPFGWSLGALTRFGYRVVMPVLFAVIGAVAATQMVGGRP